jgi:hypothetical protein
MKKYHEQKRRQLILVALATLGVMAGIWFGLISSQKASLKRLAAAKGDASGKLNQMNALIKNSDQFEADLLTISNELATLESTLATGDLYAWAMNTFRQFTAPYKIDIPQFAQVDGPKGPTLFPKFPYMEASMTLVGTGQFYEVGRFLADLENHFPFMQVRNVSLETTAPTPNGKETLAFRIEIITLVKPHA